MSKHLMSTGEIAGRFGVTRQRVGQITAKPSFPKPYDVLRVGRIWRIRDVEAWIREYRPDLVIEPAPPAPSVPEEDFF